jgi:hypothetical protein
MVNVENAYQPCGTYRMGAADDPMAEVDPRCRVIGVSGMRVAHSSIFPQITNGNLNDLSIMAGKRQPITYWASHLCRKICQSLGSLKLGKPRKGNHIAAPSMLQRVSQNDIDFEPTQTLALPKAKTAAMFACDVCRDGEAKPNARACLFVLIARFIKTHKGLQDFFTVFLRNTWTVIFN